MRIAICEDEHIYLELIKNKVVEYFKERQVSINTDSYTDASLLPAKIDEGTQYDLILMDLQMKHSDGMEIAKKAQEHRRGYTGDLCYRYRGKSISGVQC